jgi:hypothetical protein
VDSASASAAPDDEREDQAGASSASGSVRRAAHARGSESEKKDGKAVRPGSSVVVSGNVSAAVRLTAGSARKRAAAGSSGGNAGRAGGKLPRSGAQSHRVGRERGAQDPSSFAQGKAQSTRAGLTSPR